MGMYHHHSIKNVKAFCEYPHIVIFIRPTMILSPSLKIFFNSFSALINQLPSCLVLCLSSCVCLTRLILLTFVYCVFDMIQLKEIYNKYLCSAAAAA